MAKYRYRKFEFLNYRHNYRYRKIHKICADKYTQENVIKKDHSLPFYNANLFWFRANILVQGRWYCILLMQLCRKFFSSSICYTALILIFVFFGRNYRKPIISAIYRHFYIYRQNYRYRYKTSKFIGDLKELSISKSTGDLSKN